MDGHAEERRGCSVETVGSRVCLRCKPLIVGWIEYHNNFVARVHWPGGITRVEYLDDLCLCLTDPDNDPGNYREGL